MAGGSPVRVCASEITSASPRTIDSVPSVTMKGFITRPPTRIPPLVSPTAAPVASITIRVSAPPAPASAAIAASTPESATTAPTDRSTPRVRITTSWPSASTATIAVWKPRLVRFARVKK